MTETFLADYFKDIATRLKDIQHTDAAPAFYRMANPNDLDEFDNAVKNMGNNKCLLLEMGEGDIADWDAQRETDRIGLHVLVKSTDAYEAINAARDSAKATLLKIVSKIRLDCKIAADRPDGIIGPLKAESIQFSTRVKLLNMSAIDGNWYGKSFYFDFKSDINLVFDPADYIS